VGVNLTGGTFKMNGGTISGNGVNPAAGALPTPGGGVYVAASNGYPTFNGVADIETKGEVDIDSDNTVCLTNANPGNFPVITLGPNFTNEQGDDPITLDLAATRPEWVPNWVGQKVLQLDPGNPNSIATLKGRFVLRNFYYSSGNKPFVLGDPIQPTYKIDDLTGKLVENK
jgi:hypothetical protein